MQATKALPASYRKIGTLDVAKDQRLLAILNVAALFILGISGWALYRFMIWLRPPDAYRALSVLQIHTLSGWIGLVAIILGLTAIHIVLHEAIHGVFFWVFTRSRPHFAFRWAYAYASAPDWFIFRDPFLITTLAPLVVITLVGMALMIVASPGWLLSIWYIVAMNAAGAVGDMAVAIWLLRQPPTCLAQDRGDAVTLFVPE